MSPNAAEMKGAIAPEKRSVPTIRLLYVVPVLIAYPCSSTSLVPLGITSNAPVVICSELDGHNRGANVRHSRLCLAPPQRC